MYHKPDCEVCEHFADKNERPTECDKCLPELMPENEEVWKIYTVISNQLIMGPAGPIDINQLAIYEAMKLYEVKSKRNCLERVTRLARHMIDVIVRESKR